MTKLYDGTNYYTAASTVTFPFDTWSVERIEVLKGPASVLYGEGGIGGAINVIPRRPEREQSGEVRLIAGEDSTNFIGVDYTNGIGDAAALSCRLQQQPIRQLGSTERRQQSRDAGARRFSGTSATTSFCRRGSTAASRTRCVISASPS